MNVLDIWQRRIRCQMPQIRRLIVIELDEDDRAVHAVVVDARVARFAHPGEARLVQVPRHLLAAHPDVAGTDPAEVRVEQASQETLLAGRELTPADAFRLELDVVAKGGGEDLARLSTKSAGAVPVPYEDREKFVTKPAASNGLTPRK